MTTKYVDNLLGVYTTAEQYDGSSPTITSPTVGPYKRIRSALAVNTVDHVWIKANSGYSLTTADQGATSISTWGNPSVSPCIIEGYTATLGDAGRVTIDVGDLTVQSVLGDPPEHAATMIVYSAAKGPVSFRNIEFKATATASNRKHSAIHNANDNAGQLTFHNCRFDGLQNGVAFWSDESSGNYDNWNIHFYNCEFHDCRVGFTYGVAAFAATVVVDNCFIDSCGEIPGYLGMSATGIGCACKSATITNNVFINCAYNALLWDYFTNGEMSHNTFIRNDRAIELWQVFPCYAGDWHSNLFLENDVLIYAVHSQPVNMTTGALKFFDNVLYDNTSLSNASITYDSTSNPETEIELETDNSISNNSVLRRAGATHPAFAIASHAGCSYMPDSPDAPTITAVDDETGTSATVTLTAIDDALVVVKYVVISEDSENYSSSSRLGSGTVTLTLSQGETYRVWAYQIVDGNTSAPSAAVYVTATAGSTDSTYDDINNPLLFALRTTGEQVTYKKSSGATRVIWALVNRDYDRDLDMNITSPIISVVVANNATVGILDTELDTGGDSISVAVRPSGTAEYRNVWQFEKAPQRYPIGCSALTVILR